MSIIPVVAGLVVAFIIGVVIAREATISAIEQEGYKVVYSATKKAGEGRYKVLDIKELMGKK